MYSIYKGNNEKQKNLHFYVRVRVILLHISMGNSSC